MCWEQTPAESWSQTQVKDPRQLLMLLEHCSDLCGQRGCG